MDQNYFYRQYYTSTILTMGNPKSQWLDLINFLKMFSPDKHSSYRLEVRILKSEVLEGAFRSYVG